MPITLNGTTGASFPDGSAGTPAEKGSTSSTAGIFYPAANTVAISTNSTEALRVDSGGRLLVNTTSAGAETANLQIVGNTTVYNSSSTDATTNVFLNFIKRNSKAYSMGIRGSGATSALVFNNDTNGGGTDYATIDASGNLLVGTTTTVGKISSKATANPGAGYNLYLQNTWAGDVGYPALYIAKYDNNTTTSQLFIRFSVNNETQACGQINANGANTAAFGTFSDARLKENIELLPPQLNNVCALKPCEFDYIDGAGHQIGFIAQEMQQVYPDVVGKDENGMLTITGWSKTEARLVKAIQELSAKLDAAEARIAALEAK